MGGREGPGVVAVSGLDPFDRELRRGSRELAAWGLLLAGAAGLVAGLFGGPVIASIYRGTETALVCGTAW